MWIARDKGNELRIYGYKPTKGDEYWKRDWEDDVYGILPDEWYPDIKWEDDEPTEVEIVIKKK